MHIVTMSICKWMNLHRTPEDPGAPEINVSLLLEVGELEMAEHGDTIIVGVVVVPLESLRVDE
jgi:hypothetical protein